MKQQKSLLVVIKDSVEYKLIVNDFILGPLSRRFKVTIMAPVNKDIHFRNTIYGKYSVDFLDTWPADKIVFPDKVLYWLKRQLFYMINSTISESCFQKAWLHFGLGEDVIILGNHRRLLKQLSTCLCLLAKPFWKPVTRHRFYFSRLNSALKFDYILFGRPDSLINLIVYNSFRKDNTKVIAICRNLDTPALKGVYTVPTDLTVVFDREVKKHLLELNNRENIGRVLIIPFPAKATNIHKKDALFVVMYATSLPVFNPFEPEIVKEVYDYLKDTFHDNFKLKLKIHPGDSRERYGIAEAKNVEVIDEKKTGRYYDSFLGRRLLFSNPEQIEAFYNELSSIDLLMSSGSTINYEAFLAGIRSVFVNFKKYRNLDILYLRDHLRILVEKFQIPVIHGVNDLTDFLITRRPNNYLGLKPVIEPI